MEKINEPNNLTDESLKKVNGGSGANRTMVLTVMLPTTDKDKYEVIVYIDGLLESSLCNSYDSSVKTIYLKITGSQGIKRVDVKVNNISYKTFEVNFDKGEFQEF